MTYVTTADAPTTALPGEAVFVDWDSEQEAFHLEDNDEVVSIADVAAPPISGIATEPVGRRTEDGKFVVAYLAEPEQEVFTVVTIGLYFDRSVESITQTRRTGYGHGEALLATLRGDQESPDAHRFLADD